MMAQEQYRQGDIQSAWDISVKLVSMSPDHVIALHTAARTSWETGRRGMALDFQKRLVQIEPENSEFQEMLIIMMSYFTDVEALIEACKSAVGNCGEVPSILKAWGLAENHLGNYPESLAVFERALKSHPDDTEIHRNMSIPLVEMGKGEESVQAYSRWVKPLEKIQVDVGREMVKSLYDGEAAGYDDNALQQAFSEKMAGLMWEVLGSSSGLSLLDAGCGTGALAEKMKAAFRFMAGIDISPAMLEEARAKDIYDELIEGELVGVMANDTRTYDAVVSCCVLYHMAGLGPYFREASRLLAPGGHLFISVDPAGDAMDIGVTEEGEYAHSRKYLRRLAAEFGLEMFEARIMGHRRFPGFWCVFRRPGEASAST